MNIVIRVANRARLNPLKAALADTFHKVVYEPRGSRERTPADLEYISMGRAEALGLELPLQPFKVLITLPPPEGADIPAPVVVPGVLLDRQYDERQELEIVLREVGMEAGRFNKVLGDQINWIGIHEDFLGLSSLPPDAIVETILSTIGRGS